MRRSKSTRRWQKRTGSDIVARSWATLTRARPRMDPVGDAGRRSQASPRGTCKWGRGREREGEDNVVKGGGSGRGWKEGVKPAQNNYLKTRFNSGSCEFGSVKLCLYHL